MYQQNVGATDRSVGFCRLDICSKGVKISVNIREDILGISRGECIKIEAFLLMNNGEKKSFRLCDKYFDIEEPDSIVGISVIYQKANGIVVKVQGLMENKNFVEKAVHETVVQEKIEPVVKESEEKKFIRFKLEELVMLPRKYWHYSKNRFLLCGYNRYGYLAYMKKDDKYIICVPGTMSDNASSCARRHGFKTFVPMPNGVQGQSEMGYWIINLDF